MFNFFHYLHKCLGGLYNYINIKCQLPFGTQPIISYTLFQNKKEKGVLNEARFFKKEILDHNIL